MKAILIINPSSGKMKREMPPILRWTLKKLERRLSGLFKPKITEDDVIEEVKKKCDKAKIELDIEFTKYTKHATKLAKVAIDKYDLIVLLFSFTTGKLNKFLRKEYYQIKEADIYSHHNMQIQVDGEVLGIAPLSVKIIPKALNVIAASQNVI